MGVVEEQPLSAMNGLSDLVEDFEGLKIDIALGKEGEHQPPEGFHQDFDPEDLMYGKLIFTQNK